MTGAESWPTPAGSAAAEQLWQPGHKAAAIRLPHYTSRLVVCASSCCYGPGTLKVVLLPGSCYTQISLLIKSYT